MAFTQTSFKIMKFLQKRFPTPIQLVHRKSGMGLLFNPMFQTPKNKYFPTRQKIVWKTCYYLIGLLSIFALGRLVFLFRDWSCHKDFEQVGYYIVVFAVSSIAFQAYHMTESNVDFLSYLISQRFKLASLNFDGKYYILT